jgi:hypothetical protein
MRYREKLNTTEIGQLVTLQDSGTSITGWKNPIYEDYIQSQQYAAMLDTVVPNFRARIARGEIINNPMASVVWSSLVNPLHFAGAGHFPQYQDNNWYNMSTEIQIPSANNAVVLTWDNLAIVLAEYQSERDIALTQAWANVDLSEAQALASLGELPETIHWCTSLVKRMISLLRAFKNKQLTGLAAKSMQSGKSVYRESSELWLEYRYAIRPLVYDMHQLTQAWNASIVPKLPRFTARGFHQHDLSTETETYRLDSAWTAFFNTEFIVSRVIRTRSKFRAGVLWNVSSDARVTPLLWGLDKPLETVWELIPLSFVVDWFFNVGNTISSWTANAGLNTLASWISEEITIEVTDTLPDFQVNNNSQYGLVWDSHTIAPGSTVTSTTYKRRIPSPVRSKLPHFDLHLDVAKLLDLATIGKNLFRFLL